MSTYTDDTVLDDDLDDQTDDGTPLVRKLRADLKAARKEAKDANDLRTWKADREKADAFRDAGLTLNERQRKAMEAAHEGEWTADALKATAVDLGWLAAEDADDVPAAERAGHDAMAAARAGAAAPGAGRITPTTYASWSPEKRRAFQKSHPGPTDTLKRGEEVVGVAF